MSTTIPTNRIGQLIRITKTFSATSAPLDCPGQPITVRRRAWVKILAMSLTPTDTYWLQIETTCGSPGTGWIPRDCGCPNWPERRPFRVAHAFTKTEHTIPDGFGERDVPVGARAGVTGVIVKKMVFRGVEWVRVRCSNVVHGWLPLECVLVDWPEDREFRVKKDYDSRMMEGEANGPVERVSRLEKGMEGVVGEVVVYGLKEWVHVTVYGLERQGWVPLSYLEIGAARVVDEVVSAF